MCVVLVPFKTKENILLAERADMNKANAILKKNLNDHSDHLAR